MKEEVSELEEFSFENDDDNVTMAEVIDHLGYGLAQVVVVVFCGSFFCMEACELTMFSFLLPVLKEEWNLTKFETSLIGSVCYIGMFLGSPFFGWASDRFGRKDAIFFATCLTILISSLSSLGINYYYFLVCQFFVGIGIGGGVVPFSYYIEFLPTKFRGFTLINIELFWSLGTVLQTLLAWFFLSYFKPEVGWHFVIITTALSCVVTLCFLPFMPRSPRFLVVSENGYELEGTIKWIERLNCRKRDKKYRNTQKILENSKKELMEELSPDGKGTISSKCAKESFEHDHLLSVENSSINEDKKGNSSLSCCGSCREFLRCKNLFIFFSIATFYVCGSVCYYGVALSTPNFFSGGHEYLGSFVLCLSEIPGLIIAGISLYLIGRKLTQIFSYLLSSLGLALLLFPNENLWERIVFGIIARSSIMGASSVTWVIAQESMPTSIRSLGCGLASGLAKFLTCFSPLIVEMFPENNSLIPKIIFSLLTVFAAILCIFYPYETKGKSLQDFAIERREKTDIVLKVKSEERAN